MTQFLPIAVLLSVTAAADLAMVKDFGSSKFTEMYLNSEGFPFTFMLAHHRVLETLCLRPGLDNGTLWKAIWITSEKL